MSGNQAIAKPKAPPTSAQRYLSKQIDQCADNVAELIVATQKQKNQAVIAGDVAAADGLNDQAVRLSVQYADLARHQLKTIDDSTAMNQAIKGFADVNADIKSVTTEMQDLTTFANAVTTIVNTLANLITSALVTA
jgi:hypothetical protein